MLINLLLGFSVLCFITFAMIGFIFYKGMKANNEDMTKKRLPAGAFK